MLQTSRLMIFRFLLLAALLLVNAELRAEPSPAKDGFAPKLTIYLAKGPANSCGPGCDRWIAIEGHVDDGAVSRVRRFMTGVKDMQRPIYFHSPGGSVEPSLTIARLLRSRKAVARIGRTIVAACAARTQVDEACLKIKAGGGEVEAEIKTRGAICNSACGYMFLGATTREVAPDAGMGVHNSKLTLVVRGHASAQQIADFRNRFTAKATRERASFVVSMGISRELHDLINTVKFEDMHVLTRSELFRFGIDTRSFAETSWRVETAALPFVRKIAVAKQGEGTSFRTMEWRAFCENKGGARLMFVRELDQDVAGVSTVFMKADSAVAFGKFPALVDKYEVWRDTVAPNSLKALLTASTLQMRESVLTPEGKTNLKTFDIDTTGLEASWMQLLASCQPSDAQPAAASSDLNSAPAK
jgi:hypothetical protein